MEQNETAKTNEGKPLKRLQEKATIDDFLRWIRNSALGNNHVNKIEVTLYEGSDQKDPVRLVYESSQKPYEVQQDQRTGTIDSYL